MDLHIMTAIPWIVQVKEDARCLSYHLCLCAVGLSCFLPNITIRFPAAPLVGATKLQLIRDRAFRRTINLRKNCPRSGCFVPQFSTSHRKVIPKFVICYRRPTDDLFHHRCLAEARWLLHCTLRSIYLFYLIFSGIYTRSAAASSTEWLKPSLQTQNRRL